MGLLEQLNSIVKNTKKKFNNKKEEKNNNNSVVNQIPKTGLELIKRFENCHLVAYPDPNTRGKPYTIGWGNTYDYDGTPFRLGQIITQEYADKLLEYVIIKKLEILENTIPYWNEMNEQMKGALLSFAYNLGAGFYNRSNFSTISIALRDKNWSRVPAAMYLYREPGTRVEAGLARRRIAEGVLWTAGLDKLKRV